MNGSKPSHSRVRAHGRRRLGRLPRVAMLIAAAGLLAATLLPGTALAGGGHARGHGPKPTIVLVHGAWASPAGWDQVVRRLHRDGYRTVTPTLDLLSIGGDSATVRATLDRIHGKKILVAHSYGGIVISNAAAGRSDVGGLVFSAAFVPDQGDSIVSLSTGFIPSAALDHLIFTGEPFASPAFIDPAFFPSIFAQDLPAEQAAALAASQRPINASILFEPSGPVAWHTLPSWYAVSGADKIIDPAQQRSMAKRAGSTTIEFPTASHIGGITRHADQFTELIEQAVRATTS